MYPHCIRLRGPWEFEPLTATVVGNDGVRPCADVCPAAGRIKIPASWDHAPLGDFRGRVRLSRVFHSPRNLDHDEHVWLVFGGVDYFAHVSLNGELLGHHAGYFEPFQFEITSLLRPRNEVVVEVDLPREKDVDTRRMFRGAGDGAGGGIWDGVTLEVRPGIRLRNVRVDPVVSSGAKEAYFAEAPPHTSHAIGPVELRISGEVVGEFAPAPALDFSLNGRPLGHLPLEVSPQAAPFQFTARVEHLAPWTTWSRAAPAVHELRVDLHGAARTLDSQTIPFGIRDFRDVQQEGGDPQNVSLLSPQRETWSQQVARWHKAGMTFVRVPGRVLPEEMYAALDRAGIAVWQDFPIGAGQASDRDAVAEAVRQARIMVRQLRHHPSISLWCCGAPGPNEVNDLHRAVGQAMQEADPLRPCVLFGASLGT